MQAYANCDWDAVYDNIALTESEFVTKETFLEMYKDVEPVSLKELDVQYSTRTGDDAAVYLEYSTSGISAKENTGIALTRQSEKSFFFFDQWKVSSTLFIDGIEVPETYARTTYVSDKKCYEIPSILKGSHSFTIQMGDLTTVSDDFYVGDSYDCFTETSIKLPASMKNEIVELAYHDLEQIITAAADGKDFDSIRSLFSEDIQSDAQKTYQSFTDYFVSTENKTGILDLSVHDISYKFYDPYIRDGKLCSTVFLSYSYDLKHKSQNWMTGN